MAGWSHRPSSIAAKSYSTAQFVSPIIPTQFRGPSFRGLGNGYRRVRLGYCSRQVADKFSPTRYKLAGNGLVIIGFTIVSIKVQQRRSVARAAVTRGAAASPEVGYTCAGALLLDN
ncbi:hypothetical protein EVAR_3415_1 [Eumeta japonica]|uniref:Uncharacterized protein n=1 Tax=Eumeta variegata TaxID=151549 RepID=A0A4C1SS74_EUMVA|nr:hypothetical protein EVAR_3415_1 [Eumeta japonica]